VSDNWQGNPVCKGGRGCFRDCGWTKKEKLEARAPRRKGLRSKFWGNRSDIEGGGGGGREAERN